MNKVLNKKPNTNDENNGSNKSSNDEVQRFSMVEVSFLVGPGLHANTCSQYALYNR